MPSVSVFNKKIRDILSASVRFNNIDKALSPIMLTLTKEAKNEWVEFNNLVEGQLNPFGEFVDVKDVAAKSADNAARLAALFHLFNHGDRGQIELDSIRSAIDIACWHLIEAKRFFNGFALPAELNDAARLEEWIINRLIESGEKSMPKNRIRQYGPVRDKTRLKNALEELTELNRVKVFDQNKPVLVYVNPALLE